VAFCNSLAAQADKAAIVSNGNTAMLMLSRTACLLRTPFPQGIIDLSVMSPNLAAVGSATYRLNITNLPVYPTMVLMPYQ
jgi:hypothetical protein